jgi:hypothetical protein
LHPEKLLFDHSITKENHFFSMNDIGSSRIFEEDDRPNPIEFIIDIFCKFSHIPFRERYFIIGIDGEYEHDLSGFFGLSDDKVPPESCSFFWIIGRDV